MNTGCISARFLDGVKGRILVTARRPSKPGGHAVLIVPPFADEMNKTRKMFTDVSQDLAKRGIATVLPDLYGTGDSEGEFCDADWDIWKGDLAQAAGWSAAEGWPVQALLCVRLGCALGAETARISLHGIRQTVFWQPVLDGPRFLTQFLRLRVAATLMDEDRRESVSELRDRLRQGETLEVAGYELAPQLAKQIDEVHLEPAVGPYLGNLSWMEVIREAVDLPAPSRDAVVRARQSVGAISVHTVVGQPFWSTTEIVRIPELVSRTVDALGRSP